MSDVTVLDSATYVPQRRVQRTHGVLALVVSTMLAVAVSTLAVRTYQNGGAHLSGDGFGEVGGPVTTGDEFHTSVRLETGGSDIVLLSATPITSDSELRVDIRLVQQHGQVAVGAVRGPLPYGYELVELPGRTVRGDHRTPLWLDVRVVATGAGVHRLNGIAISYRAGALRTRTAHIGVGVCVSASADWQTARLRSPGDAEGDC